MKNQVELVTKISQLEQMTGKSIFKELPKVPPKNVMIALQTIHMKDLADMILDTPTLKLVKGLQIITPKQIKNVNVEKLKTVLKYGDMSTISKVQECISEDFIIYALQKLSIVELKSLLEENNFDLIVTMIVKINEER